MTVSVVPFQTMTGFGLVVVFCGLETTLKTKGSPTEWPRAGHTHLLTQEMRGSGNAGQAPRRELPTLLKTVAFYDHNLNLGIINTTSRH